MRPTIRTPTFVVSAADAATNTVWPKPQSQIDTGDNFQLDSTTFQFEATGLGASSSVLTDALKRYRGIIFLHTPVLGSTNNSSSSSSSTITSAQVVVASADESLTLETDASYNLTISQNGGIAIRANTVFGAVYGLETLSQLTDRGTFVPGTSIVDFPRYQFRATMIDTSRHYYPVAVILQHLDAMSYTKFNVLHWHIVDSIAFPYESTKFPEMSAQGAYSPDHVYTADDIRRVVQYAKNRGIRVIPEFDTPGHVRQGYTALNPPILTKCYDDKGVPIVGDGATGPLDVTLDATYDFLTALYDELQTIFPDKFVHVGGDEVPSACWASNPNVQKYMKVVFIFFLFFFLKNRTIEPAPQSLTCDALCVIVIFIIFFSHFFS